jgi:hypothetical protein
MQIIFLRVPGPTFFNEGPTTGYYRVRYFYVKMQLSLTHQVKRVEVVDFLNQL